MLKCDHCKNETDHAFEFTWMDEPQHDFCSKYCLVMYFIKDMKESHDFAYEAILKSLEEIVNADK